MPIRALWPYLRPHWRVGTFVAVVSVIGALVALAQPALVAAVISGVGESRPVGGIVGLLVALVLLGAVVSAVQQYLLHRTAEAVVRRARHDLVTHLLRLEVAEIDSRRSGDLVSRVGSDTTLVRSVVTSGLVDGLAGLVMAVGATIAMAIIDPLLLGLTAVVVVIATTVVVSLGGRIQHLSLTAQTQVGHLAAGVARAIRAIRTIRAARATDRETAVLTSLADDAYDTGVSLAKLMATIGPVIEIAMQGAFILVLGVGGYRVATGDLTVAELIAFILYLFMMVLPLGSIFNAYTSIQNALGAVARITEIIDLPIERDRVSDARASNPSYQRSDAEPAPMLLEFDEVSFRYADAPVLDSVSFAVPPGSRTAIVGPSGAGKTTVLALVERFYDPTGGVIRLSGADVADLGRDATRARIGYVEQDAPVLAGTIRQNLLLAAPDASEPDCLRVLAGVNLTDILDRDPLGLDAAVGEDGILLSGGERQRLAIARTLMARPDLLLLDEPSASLDARNEHALRQTIADIAPDRTLVIVAHRLASVMDADQIIVLDRGRVLAIGRHVDLVVTCPLYRELAERQMLV